MIKSLLNNHWGTIIFLPESIEGGWWIEDDLSAVDSVHHPVLGMVATVANVNSNLTELSLQYILFNINKINIS